MLKFIPSSYTKKGTPNIDNLILENEVKEAVVRYVPHMSLTSNKLVIPKSSPLKRSKDFGYTTAYDDATNKVYFIKTPIDAKGALAPKFLKGEQGKSAFSFVNSNYVTMLLEKSLPGVTEFEFKDASEVYPNAFEVISRPDLAEVEALAKVEIEEVPGIDVKELQELIN